jgi:hypothetical protein
MNATAQLPMVSKKQESIHFKEWYCIFMYLHIKICSHCQYGGRQLKITCKSDSAYNPPYIKSDFFSVYVVFKCIKVSSISMDLM